MAGSMKEIKLRIRSVESTMQITIQQAAPCQGARRGQPPIF